jgi:hypothetical protein
VPFGVALVLGLLFARRTRTPLIDWIALLGSLLRGNLVKVTIERERPPDALVTVQG